MIASILTSVKKSLGLEEAYTVYDADILMFINATFSTLNQLGVGPVNGLQIEDETTTWEAFLDAELRLNFVPTYVFLKVKLLFDPPATSFAIQAIETQLKEYEWRINAFREAEQWVPVVAE